MNYLNATIDVNTIDGIQEISEVNIFKQFSSRTLSGSVVFSSSTDLASTYFDISSGSGFAKVEGFTRVTYEEDQPRSKRGRMGCANLCGKTLRIASTRGAISIRKV